VKNAHRAKLESPVRAASKENIVVVMTIQKHVSTALRGSTRMNKVNPSASCATLGNLAAAPARHLANSAQRVNFKIKSKE
jgi:hypothetical protein